MSTYVLPVGSNDAAVQISVDACAETVQPVFDPHPNMGGRQYTPAHRVICSIFPDAVAKRMRHAGQMKEYSIPAVPKGKYALLYVYDTWTPTRNFTVPDSDAEFVASPISCDGIAQDLIRAWAEDAPGNAGGSKPGFMILDGVKPTQLELDSLFRQQSDYFRYLVMKADEYWITGKREYITMDHRRALRWLGTEDRDWYRKIDSVLFKRCPACGDQINAVAIICRICHTNLVEFYKDNKIRITPELDEAVHNFYARSVGKPVERNERVTA